MKNYNVTMTVNGVTESLVMCETAKHVFVEGIMDGEYSMKRIDGGFLYRFTNERGANVECRIKEQN